MKIIITTATLLLISACNSTPYKPNGLGGGYQEKMIAENKYELYFFGNGHSKIEEVKQLWGRRAMELCSGGYIASGEKTDFANTEVLSEADIPVAGIFIPMKNKTTISVPWKTGIIDCKEIEG